MSGDAVQTSSGYVAPAPALKPPLGVKLTYGLGLIPQAAGFDTALGFVFFYYTAVLGLSGGMVGGASAIALAFDALVDPLIGSWSDNTRSRFGRRLPLMILAIPFVAISMGFLFSPPGGAAPWLLFGWLTLMSIGVRCAISLFNVPYIALGAEMSPDPAERASIIAFRTIIGLIAVVAVTAGAFMLFFVGADGLLRPAAYAPFGWSVSGLLTIAMVGCCLGARRYASALPQPPRDLTPMLQRLPGELAEVFRNRSFVTLFGSAVLVYVAIGLNATLNNHAWVFIWRLRTQTIPLLGYGYLLGIFCGVVLVPALQKRFEKKTIVIAGIGMLLANWTVLQSLRALGLFTATGDAALWPQIINSSFAGIGVGLTVIAYPAMMADAADEHEVIFGHRREGLYFAGLGFAAKAATGLGVLVAGVALDLIGFPKSHPMAGALSNDLVVRMVLVWGPAAMVLGVVSLFMMAPYAISHKRHASLTAELQARRAAAKA